MTHVTFVTGNSRRHDEAKRLLAGIDVAWARLTLAKPAGTEILEEIATARVKDAYAQLGTPCFVENTGMYLDEHAGQPGTRFKKLFLELGEDEFARRFAGHGMTRVVVAYTANGADVALFEGHSEGTLLERPRGEHGYGWDRLWVPNGYDRTLAELSTSKYLVNMRHLPFLQLGAMLRGDGFDGIFESHVTVKPCELGPFNAACGELGVKCIAIELPKGDQPVQPMTAAHHRGALAGVIAEVHALAQQLVRRGYTVTRTKIEAVGRHRDVPMTDDAARGAPKVNYFEHHLKVVLPPGYDAGPLAAKCRALDAHLSRNARKQSADGSQERFITLRSYGVGQPSADARFERVVELVHELGLPIKNRVREYTVYDSAIEVDRNWMSP